MQPRTPHTLSTVVCASPLAVSLAVTAWSRSAFLDCSATERGIRNRKATDERQNADQLLQRRLPWRHRRGAESAVFSSLYSALVHQRWCDRSVANDLGLLVACQELVKRWYLGAGDALQVAEADVVLQGGDVKSVE